MTEKEADALMTALPLLWSAKNIHRTASHHNPESNQQDSLSHWLAVFNIIKLS